MLEVLIGGAIGTVGVYFWAWRRQRYALLETQTSSSELERELRRTRDNFAAATYKVAEAEHAPLVRLLAVANADCEQLIDAGFRMLGDIVIEGVDSSAVVVVRALVGSDGSTLALLSVPKSATGRPLLGLTSHSADEMFSTRRGRLPSLAEPAFAHRQTLPVETPVAQLIERHHAFARSEAFIRVADARELIAELQRARAQIAKWRDAQPADVLLEEDLQAVLGESFEQYGPLWMGRLRGRLPQATLRRPNR